MVSDSVFLTFWPSDHEDFLAEPEWELEYHKDVVNEKKFYFATMKTMEFDQHVLEMHLNGQDYFHFQTLHR